MMLIPRVIGACSPANACNHAMAGLLTYPEKGDSVFPKAKSRGGFTFSDHNWIVPKKDSQLRV